jgi:hypothetical protein
MHLWYSAGVTGCSNISQVFGRRKKLDKCLSGVRPVEEVGQMLLWYSAGGKDWTNATQVFGRCKKAGEMLFGCSAGVRGWTNAILVFGQWQGLLKYIFQVCKNLSRCESSLECLSVDQPV